MHIKSGMTVRVIRGNHRGQEGKVLYAFPKKDRVIIVSKHESLHPIESMFK